MGYAILAELNKIMDGNERFHRFRYHLGSGFVTPSDVVLDLGCGTGYGSEILAEKAMEVRSYDMEKSNIDYAKLKHQHFNITFNCLDLTTLDIPEAEVAVCFEVLEHLYKPQEFIDKLKKKIKKYIIVSVPLGQQLVDVDGDIQEVGDKTHHSAFIEKEIKDAFLDDQWEEFWSFRDGVTFIGVFYNIYGIE